MQNQLMRAKLITEIVNSAAKQAKPNEPPAIAPEDEKAIAFLLDVFDKLLPVLLPSIVTAVAREYQKQKAEGLI